MSLISILSMYNKPEPVSAHDNPFVKYCSANVVSVLALWANVSHKSIEIKSKIWVSLVKKFGKVWIVYEKLKIVRNLDIKLENQFV